LALSTHVPAATDVHPAAIDLIDRNKLLIKKIIWDKKAKFGKDILWMHLHCFVINRDQFDYLWDGELLTGFDGLKPVHQQIIKEALP
jgi:hypothetical protein